jgi:hypothetical protein
MAALPFSTQAGRGGSISEQQLLIGWRNFEDNQLETSLVSKDLVYPIKIFVTKPKNYFSSV